MPPMMQPRGFLTEEEKENLPTVSWELIKRILGYLTPLLEQVYSCICDDYFIVCAGTFAKYHYRTYCR